MIDFFRPSRSACLAIIAFCFFSSQQTTQASLIVSYDFTGEPGNQLSQAVSANGAGIVGDSFARGAGLNANNAGGSINSNGWDTTDSTDYFTFGFTTDASTTVDLTGLLITTRSSSTGPGTLGLYSSQDSFASAIYTFNQGDGTDLDSTITLSGLSAVGPGSSIEFRILEIGNTQADGMGTTQSGGTFRVENFGNSASTPVVINGTISAVPEPSTVLSILCVCATAIALRRRNSPDVAN